LAYRTLAYFAWAWTKRIAVGRVIEVLVAASRTGNVGEQEVIQMSIKRINSEVGKMPVNLDRRNGRILRRLTELIGRTCSRRSATFFSAPDRATGPCRRDNVDRKHRIYGG
jgi:hypothetical protein